MAANSIKVVGEKFHADFGDFLFELHFETETQLTFTSLRGETFGYSETVQIKMTEIRSNVYLITWKEKSGTTVTHIEDFENNTVYTNITYPDLSFYNLRGTLTQK